MKHSHEDHRHSHSSGHSHGAKKSPATKAKDLDGLLARLRASGLKITECRKAILRVLIEKHGPYSAEELHKLIPKRVCDVATVYRCLANMDEVKILRRCEFGDGTARYEIAEADNHHHHHLVCVECKKIEIVDDCEMLEEIDRFARKRGYTNVSHSLEFFGVCPDCK